MRYKHNEIELENIISKLSIKQGIKATDRAIKILEPYFNDEQIEALLCATLLVIENAEHIVNAANSSGSEDGDEEW